MSIDPSAAAVVGITVGVATAMSVGVSIRTFLLGWRDGSDAPTWTEAGLPLLTYRLGRRLRARRDRARRDALR